MDFISFDIESLYGELTERARAQGALSQEQWNALCEDLLDEKRDIAEMADDQDWKQALETLQSRYDDFAGEVEAM